MAAPKIEKLLTPYNFTNKDNAGRIKYIVIHYVGALGLSLIHISEPTRH